MQRRFELGLAELEAQAAAPIRLPPVDLLTDRRSVERI